MDLLIIGLGVLAVLFQFSAAYFVYRIHKFERLSKWCLALVLAFVLQGLISMRTLILDLSVIGLTQEMLFDRVLMVLVSLFICVGLWGMIKNFESFDLISRTVKEKLSQFKK